MTTRKGARTHIEIAALHEAGHAIAAASEGRQVGRVIVHRDRPGSGVVYHSRGCLRNPYDPTASPGSARAAWEHTRARILSDIRIKLGGPVAEAKALNQPLRAIGAYKDLTGCERLADQLEACWQTLAAFAALPSLNATGLINQQRAYMRRWIARPPVWACVRQLGETLSRRGEFQGHEVFQVLGRLHKPQAQLTLPANGNGCPLRTRRSRGCPAGKRRGGGPTRPLVCGPTRAPITDPRRTLELLDQLKASAYDDVIYRALHTAVDRTPWRSTFDGEPLVREACAANMYANFRCESR